MVRYLWIDSICIVQDDKVDWARESARMCDIFQGSYLTIAATKSSDSQGGLFVTPHKDLSRAKNTFRGSGSGIATDIHPTSVAAFPS